MERLDEQTALGMCSLIVFEAQRAFKCVVSLHNCHLQEACIRSEASCALVWSGVAVACATAILLALELGPNADSRFGGICSDYTRTYILQQDNRQLNIT